MIKNLIKVSFFFIAGALFIAPLSVLAQITSQNNIKHLVRNSNVDSSVVLDPPIVLNTLSKDVKQALVVDSPHGFKTHLSSWQKHRGVWKIVFAQMDAVVGRSGVVDSQRKQEGDGYTPAGIFKLGMAFGYPSKLSTKMNYQQMTHEDIWIDDPLSADYNTLIKKKDLKGAKSFEEMRRQDDLYKAGVIIEYNTQPVIAGKGSAIFLHIWRSVDKPTAGCVAVSEEDMLKLLKWLKKTSNPVIVIQ